MDKDSNKIVFSETLRMNQWFIILILIILNTLVVKSVWGVEVWTYDVYVPVGVVLLVDLLILSIHQKTVITPEGIIVKVFPFHKNFKHIKWSEIERYEVVKYRPIVDYGGWGIRYSLGKKGKAYNAAGNHGLKLHYADGSHLLIGTLQPQRLTKILNELSR